MTRDEIVAAARELRDRLRDEGRTADAHLVMLLLNEYVVRAATPGSPAEG